MSRIAFLYQDADLVDARGRADRLARQGLEAEVLPYGAVREDLPFDLLVCSDPRLRKLTSHPTLLAADGPLEKYVASPTILRNVSSYDGYIADDPELQVFFQHLAAGLDKPHPSLIDSARLAAPRLSQACRRATERLGTVFADVCIDVVMRVGGRPRAVIDRAIESLARQTTGRIRLILVAFAPVDADLLASARRGRIAVVELVDAPGFNRGRALAAGLAAVRSQYFMILDDDDYLLTQHLAQLLRATGRSALQDRLAYTGILRFDEGAAPGESALTLLREGPAAGSYSSILERFSSHCFLATSSTLEKLEFEHWALSTAEDSLLVSALLRWCEPIQTPGATAVYCQGRQDASVFTRHASRRQDELSLALETSNWRAAIEIRFSAKISDPYEIIRPAVSRLSAVRNGTLFVAAEALRVDSPEKSIGLANALIVGVPLSPDRLVGASLKGSGRIEIARFAPWEVGVKVLLDDFVVPQCGMTPILGLETSNGELSWAVADADGVLLNEIKIPSGGRWGVAASGPRNQPIATAVLQAGSEGAGQAVVLWMKLAYDAEEFAAAAGLPGSSREDLLAALNRKVFRDVVGAPANPPTKRVAIDLETGRSVIQYPEHTIGRRHILRTGLKAWDYFAQIHLPHAVLLDGGWIVLSLADTTEPFTAHLVDAGFTTNLSAAEAVRAGKAAVEVWLPVPKSPGDCYLVLQCGEKPANGLVELAAVEIAR